MHNVSHLDPRRISFLTPLRSYSCVSLIGIVFIKAKVPETKNKSLSQIQAELRGEAGTGYEKIN